MSRLWEVWWRGGTQASAAGLSNLPMDCRPNASTTSFTRSAWKSHMMDVLRCVELGAQCMSGLRGQCREARGSWGGGVTVGSSTPSSSSVPSSAALAPVLMLIAPLVMMEDLTLSITPSITSVGNESETISSPETADRNALCQQHPFCTQRFPGARAAQRARGVTQGLKRPLLHERSRTDVLVDEQAASQSHHRCEREAILVRGYAAGQSGRAPPLCSCRGSPTFHRSATFRKRKMRGSQIAELERDERCEHLLWRQRRRSRARARAAHTHAGCAERGPSA